MKTSRLKFRGLFSQSLIYDLILPRDPTNKYCSLRNFSLDELVFSGLFVVRFDGFGVAEAARLNFTLRFRRRSLLGIIRWSLIQSSFASFGSFARHVLVVCFASRFP